MQTNLNPFDLPGPDFLIFYVALMASAAVAIIVLRRLVDHSRVDDAEPQLDRYEIAYLAGGESRVALLGLATILDQTRAQLDKKKVIILGKPDDRSHAIERLLLDQSTTDLRAARRAIAPQSDGIRRALQSEELLLSDGAIAITQLATVALTVALLLVGVLKVIVGLDRHRPVDILVILTIATPVSGIMMATQRRLRTRRGSALLSRLRAQTPNSPDTVGQRGMLAASASDPTDTDAQLAGAMVALWGLSALKSHPDHATLQQAFAGSSGDGGSFSSSSCGGGSGCGGGGGGGGGGCGGCGGGGH